MAAQLNHHMTINALHETLQSAYKPGHSTETALIQVHNDILSAMDTQQLTILILLDLSAAFDTIDHQVLLNRMQQRIGITGVVYDWFASYLKDRTQSVCIDETISLAFLLLWGVPQGSVLGPLLFLIYILPLGDIIRRFGYHLHIYADDTQVYISLKPGAVNAAVPAIESCLTQIQNWMSANFLKLNSDKTEIVIFGTRQQLAKCSLGSLNVAGIDVNILTKPVRNLGVFLDNKMSMSAQVSNLVKTGSFHIRNIARIRGHLTQDAAKKLVNATVTSRLDYCNSLLAGIGKGLLYRLERVQHSAARLIHCVSKHDCVDIDDLLHDLHWLPIRFRIDFKIAVIAFKSINGQAPGYIDALLCSNSRNKSLRSHNQDLLLVPKTNLPTAGDRSFRAFAPKVWNAIPKSIRDNSNLVTFKKALKTHYFKIAFNL